MDTADTSKIQNRGHEGDTAGTHDSNPLFPSDNRDSNPKLQLEEGSSYRESDHKIFR